MPVAYLGLGSNKGDRIGYIESAVSEIINVEKIELIKSSSIYETEPWGISDQNYYLNCIHQIQTSLNAETLFEELKNIEKKLGRKDNKKWYEREIDIDLLFYNREIINSTTMKIPHPQIENRRFVLVPMNEVAPEFVHPILNKSISQILNETSDRLSVLRYDLKKIGNI